MSSSAFVCFANNNHSIAHAVLLFLRASLWKRTNKELLVRLVGQDGSQARARAEDAR
jgi:hypothetical protein